VSAAETGWRGIDTAPGGVLVETRIKFPGEPGRNVQPMKRSGRLWFLEDGIYVYYTPTQWRPLTGVGPRARP
jgi:hypothetical protein